MSLPEPRLIPPDYPDPAPIGRCAYCGRWVYDDDESFRGRFDERVYCDVIHAAYYYAEPVRR